MFNRSKKFQEFLIIIRKVFIFKTIFTSLNPKPSPWLHLYFHKNTRQQPLTKILKIFTLPRKVKFLESVSHELSVIDHFRGLWRFQGIKSPSCHHGRHGPCHTVPMGTHVPNLHRLNPSYGSSMCPIHVSLLSSRGHRNGTSSPHTHHRQWGCSRRATHLRQDHRGHAQRVPPGTVPL